MLHFWGIIASSAVRGSPVAAGGKKNKTKKTINVFSLGHVKLKSQRSSTVQVDMSSFIHKTGIWKIF